MKQGIILFVGPKDSPLLTWFREQGEHVIQTSDVISGRFIDEAGVAFLISYGYRHILEKEVLDKLPNRAINLHISYLPWNRGVDPNFWSFVGDTPKGVTIHYLDEGVDTGDIIVRRQMEFDSDTDTLATSYEKLHSAIQELFKQHWRKIRNGTCHRHKQVGRGSIHRGKDKEPLFHLLTDGWNTSIAVLEEYAAQTKVSVEFLEKHASRMDGLQKKK